MFHVTDGLYFERLENGDVLMTVKESGHKDARILKTVRIGASGSDYGWCSVVASMSKGDETGERFAAAQKFHESEGPVDVVPL